MKPPQTLEAQRHFYILSCRPHLFGTVQQDYMRRRMSERSALPLSTVKSHMTAWSPFKNFIAHTFAGALCPWLPFVHDHVAAEQVPKADIGESHAYRTTP